jgi:dTDP-4-amino-4,6-dideoxygalactose transaminase
MTWRRVPAVYSPISPAALAAAVGAAAGLHRTDVARLSADVARLFEAKRAILTDSGTSALVLALRAVVPRGGIVAMPGYACIDVIAAAVRAGVRVALYDVEPATLSPDLDSLRALLSDTPTHAIMVAPLYGYPIDVHSLRTLAAAAGVPVIEDAAQGAGATVGGRPVGAFGDVSVLSFGRGKGTTAGSGGALLVRREEYSIPPTSERALPPPDRGARVTAALAAQWLLARPVLYGIPSRIPALRLGEMVYHEAGEPRALSTAAAAVLADAFRLNAHELTARRGNAGRLAIAAAQTTRFAPIVPSRSLDARSGYLRFAVRDTIGSALPDTSVGAVRGYPITLDQHRETQRILASQRPLPGAATLRDRLFTLPTHSRVAARDLERLEQWLRSPGITR